MQVAIGGGDDHLLADQPAEHHGDCRRIAVPHVRIANQRDIGGELPGILLEERCEVDAAAFLLALEEESETDRQPAGHRLPCSAGLDEGHQLAFVVRRPAGDYPAAAVGHGGQPRLEWRRLPEVERIDRLDIIVPVEQDLGADSPGAGMGDHDRMTGRRPRARVKAEAAQLSDQPLRRLFAPMRHRPDPSKCSRCGGA